jgi:hypothetical protein
MTARCRGPSNGPNHACIPPLDDLGLRDGLYQPRQGALLARVV